MASRAVSSVLKRTSRLPPSFFTSPTARQTNFIGPRYFNSRNFVSPRLSVARPVTPFSNIFNVLRTSKQARFPTGRRAFSTATTTPSEHLSISQRMKQLFKEYGTSAIGVYFLLSVLDFPFCFLFVQMVGTEKIARYEHIIIEGFWNIMPDAIKQFRPKEIKAAKAAAEAEVTGIGGDIDSLAHGDGLKDQSKGDGTGASLGTVLILAYAVHKSLIFIRVPLTAAVTPKIVQKLRSWGFNIGQKGGIRKGVQDTRATLKERSKARKDKKSRDDDD